MTSLWFIFKGKTKIIDNRVWTSIKIFVEYEVEGTIMITLPFVGAGEFFELIEYAKISEMCTRPYCTTCGNMPFRNLCGQIIGLDTMIQIIEAVNENELAKHPIFEWYDPLIIITEGIFPFQIPRDNPLMEAYEKQKKHRDEKRRENLLIEEERKAKSQILREQRVLEKQKKLEYRILVREERARKIAEFEKLDLLGKLCAIINDEKHQPDYYPINFSAISDFELALLPLNTLEKISEKFSGFKKREWQHFKERVIEAIHKNYE